MAIAFYIAAFVAIVATGLALTRVNAVHALLSLALSFFAVAIVFYTLGAPFIAALEVIIYAGAIVVLFIFVVMMLNLGPDTVREERRWMPPGSWIAPGILAAILALETVWLIFQGTPAEVPAGAVNPETVGASLFGPYVLGVQLASLLLLAGVVGAFHLARPMDPKARDRKEETP